MSTQTEQVFQLPNRKMEVQNDLHDADLNARMKRMEEHLGATQEDMTALRTSNKGLDREMTSLRMSNEGLNREMTSLRMSNEELKVSNGELNEKINRVSHL